MLVASTDPASSLGDAFNIPLAGSPRRIPVRAGSLFGVEIDAAAALRRWLRERRPTLETVAVEGTWLDRDDVTKLLGLSLPGVDELAALLELARLSETGRYDEVVVDTAPTGHTLRMLAMPETLFGLAGVFDRMREKQRIVQEALRGEWRAGEEDAMIADLADTARNLWSLLRDRNRSRMSWVTLAEPMAIEEANDAIGALRSTGIEVPLVVSNRLTPAPTRPCRHCDARRLFEANALRALVPSERLARVRARDEEPRGIRALASIAADLLGVAGAPQVRPGRSRRFTAALDGEPIPPHAVLAGSVRLVLLGGKGGVGKTTCAAALAVDAAKHWPARQVLLISADPAHSLSDVFGQPFGDDPRPLPGGPANLRVRELDASRVFRRLQERYAAAVDEAFDSMRGASSFDAAHDRSVMHGLINLAPPGLDEVAAVLEITDAIVSDPPAWDLVVMDTAPTGHALRLLEMPRLMQDWSHALMSILLKYQGIARFGGLGTLLVNLSKGVRRLREMLSDRRGTAFIAVTRPSALPRLETVRLVRRLARLKVTVHAVIINAVGRGECERCVRAAAAQARELGAIERTLLPQALARVVVLAATHVPPPADVKTLVQWSRSGWRRASHRAGAAAISSTRDGVLPVLPRQGSTKAAGRKRPARPAGRRDSDGSRSDADAVADRDRRPARRVRR